MSLLMSWYWIIYFISVIENVSTVLLTFGIISIAMVFLTLFVCFLSYEPTDYNKYWFYRNKIKVSIIGMFLIFMSVLIPSKRDALTIIVGGTVFTYIEKDSSLQQLPYEIASFLKEEIKTWKNEINKESLKKELQNKSKEELEQELLKLKTENK